MWEPVLSYRRLTNSTNVYFVLAENTLDQNKTYKAQHIVKNPQTGKFINEFKFTTNTLPHSGKCEPDKMELQAAIDTVNINCNGWIDDVPFFSYEAWTVLPDGLPKLVHFGNSSTFSLKLPLGDIENNHTLKLVLKIFDQFESTSYDLNLTVSVLTYFLSVVFI